MTTASIHVPARIISPPTSLSAHAQAVLDPRLWGASQDGGNPAHDDIEGWRAMIAAGDQAMVDAFSPRVALIDADVRATELGGVRAFDIIPTDLRPEVRGRVFLDVHGGGLIGGGGEACRLTATLVAARFGVHVLSVDYRMPPDHPYPAALDDCVAAYAAVIAEYRAENVIVGGSSAGGNLAAALILRARDEGMPLPAAVMLLTPEADLTESGDTFQTNLGIDTVLQRSLMDINLMYAGENDLAHPYLSPLFGDFTKGYPPTFIQSGTRDLFLSNAVRMHRALRAAGIHAELHVGEAMPHGGFFGAPEDDDLDAEARRFLDARWR